MPQIINTNIASLNSQRHLNTTQSSLATSLERLSSGKRINSAKDDAAGLGISARMTTQVNGMNQAIRNARDGISMSQTAEGALSTSADMLQRIRTLAVQSSNATNASLDRQAIQDEVGQLAAELNRIAQTTTFNGQKLLDGTMGSQNFQVGANAGEIITANGTNFQTAFYGNNRVQTAAAAPVASGTYAGGKVTINGYLGTSGEITFSGASAKDAVVQINAKTADSGVSATARTEVLLKHTGTLAAHSYSLTSENAAAVDVVFTMSENSVNGASAAINAFNAASSKTGVTAEWDAVNEGIKLTNASGANIGLKATDDTVNITSTVGAYSYSGDFSAATIVGTAVVADTDEIVSSGTVTLDSQAGFTAAFTASTAGGFAAPTSSASKLNSVDLLDVTTFQNAQLSLAIVDAAINTVNKEMARYGALQSRFDATITNLEVNSENTANARSRIQDADYAQETANLSRASILQQAGTAMLAQANQMPQTVLSLIG